MDSNALYMVSSIKDGVSFYWNDEDANYEENWREATKFESEEEAKDRFELADPVRKYKYGHRILLEKVEPRSHYFLEWND